jgi:putative spermidine/putrescine transport system permease protein
MPMMRTALLSGALLAFALSFDEVIVTLFTAGAGTQTIPLWVLAAMQRPTQLPVVNVVAIVLVVLSVVPVYFAQRISGGASSAGGRI